MSALAKKLHVHFDDDVSVSSTSKIKSNDENTDRKKDASILNYTRDELLELAKNKLSLKPPIILNDIKDADEKRKQKLKSVFKNADVLKCSNENGVEKFTVMSKMSVGNKNAPNIVNEQDRTDFKQLIASAVSNGQHQHSQQKQQQQTQQKVDYAGQDNRRRRIGSGRIVDNYHKENNNCYSMGMDARYMRNELFKGSNDGKRLKNWKTGNEFNWKMMSHASLADSDNTDAKSDEPEWANVGVSKSDIIELHGFDGPSTGDDDKLKFDNSSENASIPLPARSTPSKLMPTTKMDNAGKFDDHFNFEDFLKLELPSNGAREHDKSESRFSQWFNGQNIQNNGSPSRNKIKGDFHDMVGPQFKNGTNQFFNNFQQNSNIIKKMTTYPNLAHASAKVRSVDELEADWCPNIHRTVTQSSQQEWSAFQYFLNQLNVVASAGKHQQSILKSAQSNYLLNLINKNSENLHQHRWSQNVAMERPDAQLYLHRLVNGEISQLHLLQELNNPRIHQCDRETLIAVLNFCNDNQQWLLNQQQQQLKYKEQMSHQLRQLQLWHLRNTQLRSPTPQELQLHTQNVMQNAVLKKQFEEQYRKLQTPRPHQPVQPKSNNNYKNQRFNAKPRYNQPPQQDGLQFIQSQSKPLWARHNGNHHPTLPVYGINDGGHMLNNNSKYPNDLLTGAMQQVFGRKISPSNLPGAVDIKDDGIKAENN